MKIQEFLAHHDIEQSPFSEEDAQTDPVFKDHCIESTYHPAWDKIYGNPGDPSTSIVLGEKGAGKTALRLQMEQHIANYNQANPHARCFVISYDDFNPFLDQFRTRVRRQRLPEKVLNEFQLWDHIDAILSLSVTKIMDGIFRTRTKGEKEDASDAIRPDYRKRLNRHQRRDMLLMAACYDDSKGAPLGQRWRRLRTRLRSWKPSPWWAFLLGALATGGAIGAAITFACTDHMAWIQDWKWAYPMAVIAGWIPWCIRTGRRWLLAASVSKHVRVIQRDTGLLCRQLSAMTASELAGQPLPNKDRTDDRYRLLGKLQAVLESLDFAGITVLVDRLDEPHLINGSADAMKAFLWPMLDNKFLKQEGIGVKFLLPRELSRFIDREDSDFYQRARLDKQNMVPSLDWTGEALFDLANARLAACASGDKTPELMHFFDESVSETRMFEGLRSLRVPRHAFRFMHRLLVAHCNRHSHNDPVWRIPSDTFETELALYMREKDATDRGLG